LDNNTIIIKPKLRDLIDSFKFYDIEKFIASGEEAFIEALPKVNNLINANN